MNLSDDILRSFTNSLKVKENKADVTMLGNVVRITSPQYAVVKLDGSDADTVARIGVAVSAGDRVSVLIKDHKAIITSNFDYPASSSSESSYIRILPDGGIEIGVVDGEGDPVGFHVQAKGAHYLIKDIDNNTIIDITPSGMDMVGGTINNNRILTVDDIDVALDKTSSNLVTNSAVATKIEEIEGASGLVIDDAFSTTSLHAVENRVITAKVNEIEDYYATASLDSTAISTAFTNTGHSLSAKISKFKNMVTLTGNLTTGSLISPSAYIAMFRIPTGYAPCQQTFFKAYKEGGTTEVTWYMDTTDNDWVRLLVSNSMEASTSYRFTVSYNK